MATATAEGSAPCERHIRITGARNFRDIGGYTTADGASQTRWHRLYRSDHLARVALDAAACAFLRDNLHVSCSVDLRSANERNQQPYTIPGITVYRIGMLAGGDLMQSVQNAPELTEELVEKLMCDVYDRFVVDAQAELGRFFRLLVERGKVHASADALVFHCKAGKDRTGVCAALLLITLGVPLETVYDDFLLTNQFYEVPPLSAVKSVLKGQIQPGAVSALFQARRSYLERALETIETKYGGVPAYMRDALMLSDGDIETLKTAYLETV